MHIAHIAKWMRLGAYLLGTSLAYALQAQPLTADYVLVGLGTSGPVIANKLTEDKQTSLIALQNGENLSKRPIIKFSENAALTVLDSLIGPPFYTNGLTSPQKLADDREILWAMATPAGGASSINAGAYCRGTRQLYAQWEQLAGPEWSVDRIGTIYKKLETYKGRTPTPRERGKQGPLNVLQVTSNQLSRKLTRAVSKATGFPRVIDYNSWKTPIGSSSQFQETQKGPDGELRVSSINAFLNHTVMTPDGHGVNGRKLRVLFDTTALRTIWKGNKAVGVEYLQDGEIKQVFARKGVIVCAGLYSSFFLLHSGVGPRDLLEPLNIPVVVDNPFVGKGLQDQPSLVMGFTANSNDFPTDSLTIFQQINWFPNPVGGNPRVRQMRLAFANPIPGFLLAVFDLVQPTSKGSLTITSADPLDPPVIDFGFLDDQDIIAFKNGLQKYIKEINNTLQATDPQYGLFDPNPAIFDSDEATIKFIKSRVSSNQSFQSHCKMAPRDQGGVVDSAGLVYGSQNLYVADNSIAPKMMDGSTMATAYLIPWNIARMLREHDQGIAKRKR